MPVAVAQANRVNHTAIVRRISVVATDSDYTGVVRLRCRCQLRTQMVGSCFDGTRPRKPKNLWVPARASRRIRGLAPKPRVRASRRFFRPPVASGALYSCFGSCPTIEVAPGLKPCSFPLTETCRLGRPSRRAQPVPRRRLRKPPCLNLDGGQVDSKLHLPTPSSSWVHPVTSFVCASTPGTTRGHAPAAATALLSRHPFPGGLRRREWVQAGPGPNRGTLIRVWPFNHRRTAPAPDTTPAALLLARLVELFLATVTSVGRLRPNLSGMCEAPASSWFPVPGGTDFRG